MRNKQLQMECWSTIHAASCVSQISIAASSHCQTSWVNSCSRKEKQTSTIGIVIHCCKSCLKSTVQLILQPQINLNQMQQTNKQTTTNKLFAYPSKAHHRICFSSTCWLHLCEKRHSNCVPLPLEIMYSIYHFFRIPVFNFHIPTFQYNKVWVC